MMMISREALERAYAVACRGGVSCRLEIFSDDWTAKAFLPQITFFVQSEGEGWDITNRLSDYPDFIIKETTESETAFSTYIGLNGINVVIREEKKLQSPQVETRYVAKEVQNG